MLENILYDQEHGKITLLFAAKPQGREALVNPEGGGERGSE